LNPIGRTWRAAMFLVKGPLILVMLAVIDWLTSPGHWWVQWAALGIGIAWVSSLLRVLRAALVAGGLAALGLILYRAWRSGAVPGGARA
ncbi:MAG TPA: hypothetical protein VFM29_09365, partial [Vicinamibacteria bacterium]|nr:hypothetical protein [Vicinamibacteria bacterium]